MGRLLDLPALIRILFGADQQTVKYAVQEWVRRQPTPDFDYFVFVLRLLGIVVDRIPWVRQVGLLVFFLDLLDLMIELYTWPGTYPKLPLPQKQIPLKGLVGPKHFIRLQEILESLRAYLEEGGD